MALSKLTLVVQWENKNQFKLIEKGDPAATPPIPDKTIIMAEENSKIERIWPGIQDSCVSFFVDKMEEIGKEMKLP